MTEPKKKRGRGRPRSFQLVQNAHGKVGGRVTRTIDGETVRKRVKLETTDDAVAKVKLLRLAKDTSAPVTVATLDETFLEAATRINARRVAKHKVRADEELNRLANHAKAILDMPVTAVTSDDVNTLLDAAQTAGQSWQSCKHIKGAISVVYSALVRDTASPVKNNPAKGATLPDFGETLTKETAVLEDAELFVYLDYKHPVPFHQLAVFQRQVMSCVSRCLGGQRTNDLHECTWDQFTIVDGEFLSAWVVRTKGQQAQRMEVPAVLRPILRAWWEQQGQPLMGLVFPTLRGKRLGQVKRKVSHAKAFRKDLQRAFGIEKWDPKKRAFVKCRDMTARERELFVASRFTDPVDFHSWRRAFSRAVEGAALDAEQKRKLSGHETEAMRQVYLAQRREWVVPASVMPSRATVPGAEAAAVVQGPHGSPSPVLPAAGGILGQLPALNQEAGFFVEPDSLEFAATYLARPKGFEPLTSGSGGQQSNSKPCENVKSLPKASDDREPKSAPVADAGLNSRPKIGPAALPESDLADLLELASKAKNWPLAAAVLAQLEALAAQPDGVINLAEARKRRDRDGGK